MKNYLTTLLFCLLLFSQAAAQNWQPFTLGESFHYRHDSTFPERTVRIDSATNHGGDSIWHFNRLFELQSNGMAYVNGPNLGGRSLRIHGNGRYQFFDPEIISLDTWAHVGDTCLRDSLHPNHYGIITREAQDFVLGEVDSIKVIVIAPDTMVISKAHGIVKWPAILGGKRFALAGIQERHLGDTLPGYSGFIQYQVGDVYYWDANWGGNDGGSVYGEDLHLKAEIIAIQHTDTNTHVSYRAVSRVRDVSTNQIYCRIGTGGWDIPNLPNGLVTRSHQEPVQLYNVLLPICPRFLPNDFVNGLHFQYFMSPDPGLIWTKAIYQERGDTMRLTFGPGDLDLDPVYIQQTAASSLCGGMGEIRQSVEITYRLGLVSQESRGFEHGSHAHMVGHIINGDTVGTIYEESYLLGNNDPQPQIECTIFPNPAHDHITIQLPAGTKAELRILDLMGHAVQPSQSVLNGDAINLQGLAAGMYMVEVRTRNATAMKRLQIVH